MKALQFVIFSCFLFFLVTCSRDNDEVDDKYEDPQRILTDAKVARFYLQKTLTAITKALKFFRTRISEVNLDGAIGVRQVEGLFQGLLSRYTTQLPQTLVTQLRTIVHDAESVARKVQYYVARRTPNYYNRMSPLIKPNHWDVYYVRKFLHPHLVDNTGRSNEHFSEKFGDDCLSELFGTNAERPCSVSKKCWHWVTSMGRTKYSLTHQIFYILNAIQAGCLKKVTHLAQLNGTSIDHLLDRSCSNIFQEVSEFEDKQFPVPGRDLFMEQIGHCGLAGYTQLARWRFLPIILSWQQASGCYGFFSKENLDPSYFDPTGYGYFRRRRSADLHSRSKRVEVLMTVDGCLSHRTSVALNALSIYVRRIVESAAPQQIVTI